MQTKQTVGSATLETGKDGNPRGVEQRLKSERVQDELRAMPGWNLGQSGTALHRRREFFLPADAAMYAACAAHLAASLQQRVQLQFSGKRVVLTVFGPKDVGGISWSTLDYIRQLG